MERQKEREIDKSHTELMKDLLITELARAGVPQLQIRKIVGCRIQRVNRIAKYVKREK
jgi:hypothetical protein